MHALRIIQGGATVLGEQDAVDEADMGEWEDARLRRDAVVPVQATGLRVSDDLPPSGQAGPPGESNLLRGDGAESAPPGLLAARHFIGAQHPAAEGVLHRLVQQIGELVVRIEPLYSLVGPSLVEKRVGRDPIDDLQRQARLEMVLQIMNRAERQEASAERDDWPGRAVHLSLGVAMCDRSVEIVEVERFR